MGLNIDFNQMSYTEQLQFYINRMHPAINKDALFADGTPGYRSFTRINGGYAVTLRFRTAKNNAEQVQVVMDGRTIEMKRCYSDALFDYYECCEHCGFGGQEYYFKITSGKMVVYYNKRGVMDDVQSYYSFLLVPEFHTPDWAKGAVFYQIFVDRFCNGDPSNDVVDKEYFYVNGQVEQVKDWNSLPAVMDVNRFYGGDLQGVMDKLDYLQELGVEVIYLNPIFVSPSNHKYDIQDYDYIDPHFGKIVDDGGRTLEHWETENTGAERYIRRVTNKKNLEASNAFFAKLVEAIHQRGMKVILDGVFNHCGSFNKWMDRERIYENQEGYAKGAYVAEESPYHTFFKFVDNTSWPYNKNYDGWWGHDTLPKLNYEESSELESYILDIARKWVSPPYNVDGWRLDVAADLGHSSQYNHEFWKRFRQAVKEVNPDALILAEHYGDPASWIQGDQWDTVMNYDAFMEPVTWFLAGVEKHSDEYCGDLLGNHEAFFGAMSHHMSRFHYESLYVAMNELSNHDHSRFLTRTNHRVGRLANVGSAAASDSVDVSLLRAAVIIQMTWPGAPTIYYGDEAGVCGWTDPDSRRPYPWGNENKELIRFHKDIIKIHKEHPALRLGSLKFLAGDWNVLAYGRFDRYEQLAVAVNNHPFDIKEIRVPVWQLGIENQQKLKCLIMSTQSDYTLDMGIFTVCDGCINMTLQPCSAMVLHHENQ